METTICLNNLEALCRGCSFLGSGGGGDSDALRPIVERALAAYGSVPLLAFEALQDHDLVITIEMMGAPVPTTLREPHTPMRIKPVLDAVLRDLGRPARALMAVEIGGSNALVPLCVAGETGLPVMDGDLLGRALPEIPMISPNLFDRPPNKAYIADPYTGQVSMLHCTSYEDLEQQGRAQAASHASSAAILIPLVLSGGEVKRMAIAGTLRHSIAIGQQTHLDALCRITNSVIQCRGTVVEWSYELRGGFLMGQITIRTDDHQYFKIRVKNEYLSLMNARDHTRVDVPDIITLLDAKNLKPILSDQLRVHDTVICVTCRGPELWYSDKGLSLCRIPVSP